LTHFALICSPLLTVCLPKDRPQKGVEPCHGHDSRSATWSGPRVTRTSGIQPWVTYRRAISSSDRSRPHRISLEAERRRRPQERRNPRRRLLSLKVLKCPPNRGSSTNSCICSLARGGRERQLAATRQPSHPIPTLNYTLLGRGFARLPCTLLRVTSLGVSSCPSHRRLDPGPPGPQPETGPGNLAGLGTCAAQTGANRLI
jgi:hypothetical protein